jgi:uncharacterized protein YuzE
VSNGLAVGLTDERLAHILEHPEMQGMEGAMAETLAQPERAVQSFSDPHARVYYGFCAGTRVGDKFLCVPVKVVPGDAFALTGYLTDRIKQGVQHMAERNLKVWFDPEGDCLEVIFDQKPGYFRETANDQVMEKVDEHGNVLGFSVLRVSALKEKPLEVAL